MSTKQYQQAEEELERLINLEKNLSGVNTKLLEGREILETLTDSIEKTITTNVPILREYLKDLIEIRMAFGREVIDLLRSSSELSKITKSSKEIIELGDAVVKLQSILTPEVIQMLKGVFKND